MRLKSYIFVTLILTIFTLFGTIQLQEVEDGQNITELERNNNWYRFRHHAEIIPGNSLALRCGGAILYCVYIITTANCVTILGKPIPPQFITVQTYIKDMTLTKYRYNVTNIFVHPQFRRSPLMHDLAIIKITPKIIYTDREFPALLPKKLMTQGVGITSGIKVPEWSPCGSSIDCSISEGDTFDNAKAHSFRGDVTNCLDYSELDGPYPITDNVFCTLPIGSFSDAQPCSGDVGGPFVTFQGNRAVLHGIMSERKYCQFSPTMYTAIFPYKKWINSIIKKH